MNHDEQYYEKAVRTNLESLLSQRKMTRKRLADEVGVAQSSVTQWLKGKNSITLENFFKICDVLGVTGDELAGRNSGVYLSQEEKELLYSYRISNEKDRGIIRHILDLPEEIGEWDIAREA